MLITQFSPVQGRLLPTRTAASSHLDVVHRRLIGAVISVSAPFPPLINIRCRGTRDGGNTGGDTNDTNSTLSDIGPIPRACIVIALVAFTPPRKCCRSEGMTTQKFYPRNDIRTFR